MFRQRAVRDGGSDLCDSGGHSLLAALHDPILDHDGAGRWRHMRAQPYVLGVGLFGFRVMLIDAAVGLSGKKQIRIEHSDQQGPSERSWGLVSQLPVSRGDGLLTPFAYFSVRLGVMTTTVAVRPVTRRTTEGT